MVSVQVDAKILKSKRVAACRDRFSKKVNVVFVFVRACVFERGNKGMA